MKAQHERYQRQVLLPQLGLEGQQKLLNAHVLVVGAGGLGCPVLQYLVAAGVGRIGIIDDDVVSASNLHRQILYGTSDVGEPKAAVAAKKLAQLNPDVSVQIYPHRLTTANAWKLVSGYDIVVDGSDNFATRYLLNDVCYLLQTPLVYGSIYRVEGQVAVFNGASGVHYRNLYPHQPAPGEVADCAEAGVLGVLPGIIGSFMANEVIKLITGMGQVLDGQLLTYHSLTNQVHQFALAANGEWQGPTNQNSFEQWNYGDVCLPANISIELDIEAFDQLLTNPAIEVIDVREPGETPEITAFAHRQVPLSHLRLQPTILNQRTVILFCQTGRRSAEAAALLAQTNTGATIYTLKTGIAAWTAKHPQVII